MAGMGNLLEIGKRSLFASQTAIQVTGNNISNANTEGYSRQGVRLEDGSYATTSVGQLGSGVNAAEVVRYFDEFIESQYLAKSSDEQRWETMYNQLQGVETLFNESNSSGLNTALSEFWDSWSYLAANPDDANIRAELMSNSQTLTGLIQSMAEDLHALQDQTDDIIKTEVNETNALMGEIAELNDRIWVAEESGNGEAVGLRDERATLLRQLAEKVDINVIDTGTDSMTVTTNAGQVLIDGGNTFRIAFESAQVLRDIRSDFEGTIQYEGDSSYEYLIKVVDPGPLGTATFKVSVDGGTTWLKDENGQSLFTADDADGSVLLPDKRLRIYFDQEAGSGDLEAGDTFTILPKGTLFWYETSATSTAMEDSGKVNITSRYLPNGEDDSRRLVGGTLAGLVQFRDASVGSYLEKLNAFSESMIWEVNRLHSQGSGLDTFTEITGTSRLLNSGAALGESSSGLVYSDKLTAGNLTLHVYNKSSGTLLQSQTLDFDAAAGVQNFDPATMSLQDVTAAINRSFGSSLTATIEDNHLKLTAADGVTFALGTDSTGLMAALGLNSYFDGTDAQGIAVNSMVRTNLSYISSGHVNGAGEMNEGDNTTAAAIASLQTTSVAVRTVTEGTTWQTLDEYYSTIAAKAGSDIQGAQFNYEYQQALADDLRARQEAVAGVNLDEEMTNLIKFQHAYTAAAKLITTAESMMEVLLGLKQ